MSIRRALVIMLCIHASGCTTSLEYEKILAGKQPSKPGIAYYLPRQVYAVTVTYELKNCPTAEEIDKGVNVPLQITQTALVAEATVADEHEKYSIPLDTLTSGWKTTSLITTLYDNQTLHTLNATVDDRSVSVVKGVISSALSVMRLTASLPASIGGAVDMCTPEVYQALGLLKSGTAKLLDQSIDEKTRATEVAKVTYARSQLQLSQTYLYEPDLQNTPLDVLLSDNNQKRWIASMQAIDPSHDVDDYYNLMKTQIRLQTAPAKVDPLPEALIGKGIIYREPVNAVIQVCTVACGDRKPVIASYSTQISQLGRYAALPLKNRPFEKNNLAVSFSANGRLESVTYGSESRFEKMASSASESLTAYESYVNKKQSAQATQDAAQAAAPLQAVKAETEMLKAKADKIEAERRLIGLGGE
jgi:hypothetical protein